MPKRNIGLLIFIYFVAIVTGVTLNWTGIIVGVVIFVACFFKEVIKIPFFAPMTQNRRVEYTGPLLLGILLMLVLGFLSHAYGWHNIFAFLAHTFLRS